MPISPSVQNRTSRLPFVSDGFVFKEHVRRFNNMQRTIQERFGKPAQYISGVDGSRVPSPTASFLSRGSHGYHLGAVSSNSWAHRSGGSIYRGGGPQYAQEQATIPRYRTEVTQNKGMEDEDLLQYLEDRHRTEQGVRELQTGASGRFNQQIMYEKPPTASTKLAREQADEASQRGLRRGEGANSNVQYSLHTGEYEVPDIHDSRNAMVASSQVTDGPAPGRQRPKRHSGAFLGDEAALVADLEDLFQGLRAIRNPGLSAVDSSVSTLTQSFVESNSIVKRIYRPHHQALDLSEELIDRMDEFLRSTSDQQTLAAAKRAIVKIHRGMNSDSALEVFMAECQDNHLSQVLTAMILQVL